MPRKARVDAPGALHHMLIRGIERKPIFKDKIDYANFIDRLSKVLVETGTDCFAWALIINHTPIFFLELVWFRFPLSCEDCSQVMLNSSIVATSAMDIFSKTGTPVK